MDDTKILSAVFLRLLADGDMVQVKARSGLPPYLALHASTDLSVEEERVVREAMDIEVEA